MRVNRRSFLFFIPCLLIGVPGIQWQNAGAEPLVPESYAAACTDSEQWKVGKAGGVYQVLEDALERKKTPLYYLSQALYILKTTSDPLENLTSKYLIARSLFNMKFYKASESAFLGIIESLEPKKNYPFAAASLQCLNRIYTIMPSLIVRESVRQIVLGDLGSLVQNKPASRVYLEFLFRLFLTELSQNRPSPAILERIMALFGGSVYEKPAIALWNSAFPSAHSDQMIRDTLTSFFEQHNHVVDPFDKLTDVLILLWARSCYALGHYEEAFKIFRKLTHESSQYTEAIVGESWSALKTKQFGHAVGIGLGVQAVWLKKAFLPETHLVAAIALHQICRYPEALKLVQQLVHRYDRVWKYLQTERPPLNDLYPTVTTLLKDPMGEFAKRVPLEIAAMWIYSPTFLKVQQSINNMLEDELSFRTAAKNYADEKTQWAQSLSDNAFAINKQLVANSAAMAEQKDPKKRAVILEQSKKLIREFRAEAKLFKEFYNVKPQLVAIYKKYAKEKHLLISLWTSELNIFFDFQVRLTMEKMRYVLLNLQALTAEIYDEASKDLIWQNAHPEAHAALLKKKSDEVSKASSSFDTLNWGSSPWDINDTREVWEDESDSLIANLTNNCSNVKKFIDIPMRR
jgi:tetratricopeptide (TPR) repeat protein